MLTKTFLTEFDKITGLFLHSKDPMNFNYRIFDYFDTCWCNFRTVARISWTGRLSQPDGSSANSDPGLLGSRSMSDC